MTTITTTTKYEDLPLEDIINNYIRLKTLERERNKKSYEKLKNNKDKYFDRLNSNLEYQLNRIDDIKSDEEKLKQHKERRKEINKKAYLKRKQQQQQQQS
jgi:hypothetical protein